MRVRATALISQFGDAGLAPFWLPRLQIRRIWTRAQQAINPRRGASAHGRNDVRVGVHRHADARVAEPFLDEFRVRAVLEQQGCVGVP